MKGVSVIWRTLLILSLCIWSGCELTERGDELSPKGGKNNKELSVYASYGAAKIDILPLTEFVGDNAENGLALKVYVSLQDWFGCDVKAPGVFRFELYEHVVRSSQAKGRRVLIWPDMDLADPVENNRYWNDFLRAYEFDLDFELPGGQGYILQVTCMCPNGKRISDEYGLDYPK